MKKKLTLLLAITMSLSVMLGLASCGSGGGNRGGDGELVDIIIYSQLANFSGVQSGWSAQILEDLFNVRVTIINEMDGTFATRMTDGFLGDIVIFGSDGNQYRDAVESGMLLDWEKDDLLRDYGPYINENMQAALQKNRDLSKRIYDDDDKGIVHGFGFGVAGSPEDHDSHIYYPYLRWDLYQQLGKPPINTLEDFIPILLAMKELEPLSEVGTQTYGVSSFPDWDDDMVMMVKATPALYGWEEFGFGLYNVLTQEFQGCLEPDGEYIRSLRFYNTLNQLGLFDPDSMTQTFHDAAAKYRNGVSFWNIFTFVAEDFNKTSNLEAGRSLQCVPAADQKNLVEGLNIYGGSRVWAIGARTDHPELCMEIINWLCTPDGVLSNNLGPRGVTWDYDENGDTYMTPVGLLTREDRRTLITFMDVEQAYQDGEFQHNNTTWNRDAINPDSASGDTFNWENWVTTIRNKPVTETEQSWRDWASSYSQNSQPVVTANEFLRNENKVAVSIGTPFSMASRDAELDTTWEQVKMSIRSGSWDAIYARSDQEFDDIIATMIRESHAYGYADCIAWIEEQAEIRRGHENEVRRILAEQAAMSQ
jgi:multiple sugar transport system substrate-binding protein/putative aldouronate transport system substrate-binding protein